MSYKPVITAAILAAVFSGAAATAQAPASDEGRDEIIVTGTRSQTRTAFESLAPVDVLSAEAIQSVVSDELMDALVKIAPSFNVQRQPLNDGAIFVRPASLRNLSPDQTLVLVNGKRRHRSALLGNRGAQATDLGQIPTSAIQRIEVLRDGASAQYGSDAIAGVINIILDDEAGYNGFGQYSQYYEGDGRQISVGGQAGWAFADEGFVNLTLEVNDQEATSRSRQRADAIAFQQATGIVVADPVQNWGQPERDSWRLAFNAESPLSEGVDLYSFGTYGQGEGVSDFNWRNPDSTSAYRTSPLDPAYDLSAIFPAGFTPRFGQEDADYSLVGGLRGETGYGVDWDASASYGSNEIDYFINDTINGSLGSASPTSFRAGVLTQDEFNLNLDGVYAWAVGSLAEPVNVAFGLERRQETYEIAAGDLASYSVGPLAVDGLPSGSNGFPGYSDLQAGSFEQDSFAAYVDLEAALTARLTLGGAVRHEDFSEFGANTDYKVSARFEATPNLALRGTVSTGFRAPTPGQLFSERTSQGLNSVTLNLVTNGRFNPTGPVADIINARAGGPFIAPLEPETSDNYSLGMAWRSDAGLDLTVDLYQIDVADRFSTVGGFTLSDAERAQLVALSIPGGESITSAQFFQNQFDTQTRGLDIVGSWTHDMGPGAMTWTGAYNHNETEVTNEARAGVFNDVSRTIFEQGLPQDNASFSGEFKVGRYALLGRVRYYGEWTDTDDSADVIYQDFGAQTLFDIAATMQITDIARVRVGAENVFDTYPDESRRQANRGLIYSRNTPYDTDGGQYYVRLDLDF